jgi:hypothetical protein
MYLFVIRFFAVFLLITASSLNAQEEITNPTPEEQFFTTYSFDTIKEIWQAKLKPRKNRICSADRRFGISGDITYGVVKRDKNVELVVYENFQRYPLFLSYGKIKRNGSYSVTSNAFSFPQGSACSYLGCVKEYLFRATHRRNIVKRKRTYEVIVRQSMMFEDGERCAAAWVGKSKRIK